MNIFYTGRLSKPRRSQLLSLISACRQHEPITFELPADGEHFLLGYDRQNQQLVSCLIMCPVDSATFECYGFTHPRQRRKGFFTALFARAAETHKNRRLLLIFDEKSPDAAAFREKKRMICSYRELFLQREVPSHPPSPDADLYLHKQPWDLDGLLVTRIDAHLKQAFGPLLGSCFLLPQNQQDTYLFGLEIQPEFKRCGWGTKLVYAVFSLLPAGSLVSLQVSDENLPALALYKKTGFLVKETLSYYERN